MPFVTNMRIANKILLALCLFVALCAGLTGWAVYQSRLMAADTQRLVAVNATSLHLAGAAQEAATRLDQLVYAMLVAKTAEDVKKLADRFKEEADGQQDFFKALKPILSGDDSKSLAVTLQAADAMSQLEGWIVALKQAGRTEDAAALLAGNGDDAFAAGDDAFDAMVEHQRKLLADGSAAARRSADGIMWTLIGSALVGTLLIGGLALALVRAQVTGPLSAMTSAMRSLAAGDISVSVPALGRRDEIGEIADAVAVFKSGMSERNQLQAEAVLTHQASEQKLRETEEAFRAAGRDQAVVVDALGQALGQLAGGDLGVRIEVEVAAVYGALKDDFNAAIKTLENTITVVMANARGITSGAGEISLAAARA